MLFEPISIRDVTLKNRVVVAPMHQYAAEKGFATDWHLVNAGRYAAGGAGLVIMESTKVERRGCGTVGDLGLWDDAFIPGLKRCVDFIRLHNSVPGIQLGHSGRKARRARPWEGGAPLKPSPEIDDWDQWELVSSSGINSPDTDPTPRALTLAEIPEAVERWGQAARRAHEAGFDVLDIHMAHGYLIHQFLSPFSNVRNDQYGGSELNRMRFAIEVVESVRAHWPASKPLFVRLSVEDDSGFLSMAVGLIVHADQAEKILQEGRADLIALARELLYNPNWPMDAAQKLGVDSKFASVPPAQAYWLAKRAQSVKSVVPSTYMKGLNAE
jgi:2,4-dienoyl-CoA reductase-like NADH-dependent reductase (Old Yellow Enzyme family)